MGVQLDWFCSSLLGYLLLAIVYWFLRIKALQSVKSQLSVQIEVFVINILRLGTSAQTLQAGRISSRSVWRMYLHRSYYTFVSWSFFFKFLVVLGLCCGAQASLLVAHGLSSHAAHGILVHWPGIEPTSPALEGGFLTTGPPRKSLLIFFLKLLHSFILIPYKLWDQNPSFFLNLFFKRLILGLSWWSSG